MDSSWNALRNRVAERLTQLSNRGEQHSLHTPLVLDEAADELEQGDGRRPTADDWSRTVQPPLLSCGPDLAAATSAASECVTMALDVLQLPAVDRCVSVPFVVLSIRPAVRLRDSSCRRRSNSALDDVFPVIIRNLSAAIEVSLADGMADEHVLLDDALNVLETLQSLLEQIRQIDSVVGVDELPPNPLQITPLERTCAEEFSLIDL
jgi:hypothetical protein